MRYRVLWGLLCLTMPVAAQKQEHDEARAYPKDYFRNPLDIPIYLAGNFGECRPGHFHSGMDIKTLGEENQPVHAAADGYISRIKMEKGGFGHAIYITHPNGYTTLYAHLNNFFPALEQALKAEQYAKERWDIDKRFGPDDFPVAKGQLIAWSGNTGASTAPHLHFEIRNTQTEHPLNGEQFGFEVVDKTPPVLYDMTLYNGKIYEDSTLNVTLTRQGNTFVPKQTDARQFHVNHDTVEVRAGLTGIGINTDDFMDGSDNTLAPYTISWFLDDTLQGKITIDDIGYDETRYINAYADYKTHELKHRWEVSLFRLPGNKLGKLYSHLNHYQGRMLLPLGSVHKVTLQVTDDRDNTSAMTFYARATQPWQPSPMPKGSKLFAYNTDNEFNAPGVSFTLGEQQLYDSIYFTYNKSVLKGALSDRYSLHESYVPLHRYFDLKLRPNKPIPISLRSKVAMRYSDGEDEDGRAAGLTENGWYTARVRDFGDYWLVTDTVPPVIRSLQKSANLSAAAQITFEVKDELTSVKHFEGVLDGKWICFEQHGNLFFYKFDEHCPKGKHQLVFKAEDENGNKATYTLNFTR